MVATLKTSTIGWLIVIIFILRQLNRSLNIVEQIGGGAEAQLSSHSSDSLFIGTGDPIAANAHTSLHSSQVHSPAQRPPAQRPPASYEKPLGPPPRYAHSPSAYHLRQKDIEIARLQYQLRHQKSLFRRFIEFLFGWR